MKCVCPMGGDRTCPDDCPLAVWASLTPTDRKAQRKPIAEKLFKQGFTMEAIATQLGVSNQTIGRDLEGFSMMEKLSRPKGGRPHGKRKSTKRSAPTPDIESKMAHAVLDHGKTLEQVTKEFNLPSVQHAKLAVAKEQGRREPRVERDDLSLTAQQKLDAAIRAHIRKLDADFEVRCREDCIRWLNDVSLPQYAKELAALERSIAGRKGVMDRITYRKILACLHPDRVTDPVLKKRYEEAFRLFTELEKRVLDEKQSPTQFRAMPRTYEELMRMRAKVQAERKARRTKSANGLQPR